MRKRRHDVNDVWVNYGDLTVTLESCLGRGIIPIYHDISLFQVSELFRFAQNDVPNIPGYDVTIFSDPIFMVSLTNIPMLVKTGACGWKILMTAQAETVFVSYSGSSVDILIFIIFPYFSIVPHSRQEKDIWIDMEYVHLCFFWPRTCTPKTHS